MTMLVPAICMFVVWSCRVSYSDDDIFFTELYKVDEQGTAQWESDGGLSPYRPLESIEAPSAAVPLGLASG